MTCPDLTLSDRYKMTSRPRTELSAIARHEMDTERSSTAILAKTISLQDFSRLLGEDLLIIAPRECSLLSSP